MQWAWAFFFFYKTQVKVKPALFGSHMTSLWLSVSPGRGHPISGQPRVEELHPRLHVQWLRPRADIGELIQAKKTHFYVFGWQCCVCHFSEAVPCPLSPLSILIYCSLSCLVNILLSNWKDFAAWQAIYSVTVRITGLYGLLAQAFGQASNRQLNI